RIGSRAAGYVKSDRLDRRPARAHFDAERIGETLVARFLPFVIGLDAIAREFQRVERFRLARFRRHIDVRGADAQAELGKIGAVEFRGKVDERAVATRYDIGDDAAHHLLDVLRRLALLREQRAELRVKIRALAVQTNRHRLACMPGIAARITGEWVIRPLASTLRD